MKPVYLRQAYMGTTGDIKTLEHHFALMAERGWMIDKIGLFTHRYRSIEPCKMRFFVDLLPQITMFDYPENKDAQDYRSLCEESGWTFVAATKQINVFCADGDTEPVPIHTDNGIQAQIYLKYNLKYELFALVFSGLMIFFIYLNYLISDGIRIFLSNLALFLVVGYTFFLIGYGWLIGFMLIWRHNTKKAVKLNLPMPIANYRISRIRNAVYIVSTVITFICFITGVLLELFSGKSPYVAFVIILPFLGLTVGFWIRRQIDTKHRDRKANKRLFIIAIVVMEVFIFAVLGLTIRNMLFEERIPDNLGNRPALTLRDIGLDTPPDENHSGARVQGSVAVPVNYSYWESCHYGSVNTEVFRSVNAELSRRLYKRFTKDLNKDIFYLNSVETAAYGAEEAVTTGDDLLLLNGKTILKISYYSEIIDDSFSQAIRNLWSE